MSYSLKASHEYIKCLDGVRGISVLIVLFSHLPFFSFIPGQIGVNFFFFISGFIITRLLLSEHNTSGKFSIKSFYIRRAFRLLPALYFYLIISAILSYCVLGLGFNLKELIFGFLYWFNYYIIWMREAGVPLFYKHFTPLWSLSVEEHFYLLYPLIISFYLKGKKSPLGNLGIFVALILIWRVALRYLLGLDHDYLYYATDCKIDIIIYGAILSLMCNSSHRFLEVLKLKMHFYLGLAFLFFPYLTFNREFVDVFGISLFGLGLAPIIYNIIFNDEFIRVRKFLESKVLVLTGKLSYSLYLWHFFCIIFVKSFINSPYLVTFISLPLSFIVSWCSYSFVELPFLRYRVKFLKLKKLQVAK